MEQLTAILFPGQGSQEPQMGKNLAEKNSEIMDLWKKAENASQLPLREVYWESNDEALMSNTAYLQPALTVTNLGLWLEYHNHFSPKAVAGHSLGEFSALAAAKILTFDEVVKLVALRGKLMNQADPHHEGTMYVVLRLSLEEIVPVCEEVAAEMNRVVKVANHNTPKQYALSGHKDAVEAVIEKLKPNKCKAIPLAVSGPFHTSLMAEVNGEFVKQLDALQWNTPLYPIYSNVNAEPVIDGKKVLSLMKKQIVSSVLWSNTVENMYKNKINHFVEIGPKGVLSRMVPHILTQEVTVEHIGS